VTPRTRLVFGRARRTMVPHRAVVTLAIALTAIACGSPAATFQREGPCDADGRAAGAYPDLEARLPQLLDGAKPTSVDSGRSCTEVALGSLTSHGLDEIRFAGATWNLGGGLGVTSVVFADAGGSDLPAEWIAEFYGLGARNARRTENIETSRPTFDGAGDTWRLDTLNNLSLQTIVTWQDTGLVRVILVATGVSPAATREAHEELVDAIVRASAAASAEASPAGG
jgi:hypothetical protein